MARRREEGFYRKLNSLSTADFLLRSSSSQSGKSGVFQADRLLGTRKDKVTSQPVNEIDICAGRITGCFCLVL